MARMTVSTPEKPVEISAFIYGDFVEFIGRMTDAMWGERLDDRKFAGYLPPRAEFIFLPEEEAQFHRPWRDTVWQARGRAVLDEADPFCGPRCMRIVAEDVGAGGWVGIRQKMWVREGEALRFSGYFRSSEPVRVRVAVGRFMGSFVQPYGEAAEFDVSGEQWHRIEAELASRVSDEQADFVLLLESKGTLWVDSLSLLSERDLHRCRGWRGDIVEAVRALKPGIMRFGGSAVNRYAWRQGVGDRDERVPFPKWPWGGMESNDVGLDEFLDFCALVDAEPLVCVNAATEGPDEAVALMEHCAARGTSPRVRFWQVGNELSGDEYEEVLAEFCRAMKRADPNAALLTSYAPSQPTLKEIAGLIEYVAPHFYELSIEKAVAEIAELRERLDTLPETRHVKIAVTEWNETGGRWGVGRACLSTLGNGLYVGRMLNHFRRNADLITIANRSNLVDSWLSGSIQVCGSRMWFHPAYHVQRLFANYGGRRLLRVEGPPADLDMTAALDDAGNVCLTVVNTASESRPLDVELTRIAEFSSAKAYVVAGDDESICNHVAEPDKIGVEEQSVPISGGGLEWRVPAHAAAVVVAGKEA